MSQDGQNGEIAFREVSAHPPLCSDVMRSTIHMIYERIFYKILLLLQSRALYEAIDTYNKERISKRNVRD
jgi:hypothetical protein